MKARETKCVVWDLDDTLWQGTLLEADQLILTPGVTDIIRELDNRGILQSVASRNDYGEALRKLTAFGLRDYFLHPQVGWGNKSDFIKRIASKLGISLDTFIFVDDQPFERDEVRHFLPEVITVSAADINKLLAIVGLQPGVVTSESRARRRMYQADILRSQSEDSFSGSKEDFLATLGMRLTIRAAREADLRRAEELTLRTNQLNTTGRTYSLNELSGLLNSNDHLLLVAELEDRYGPSGTIGLVLIEQGLSLWRVKLLITSCRVMTRGIGGIMISYFLRAAKSNGVKLHADFVLNDRNRMMYVTYKFNGFYEIKAHGRNILLQHDLERIRPYPPYVEIKQP